MGRMIDRVQRELTAEDIAKIAGTYHAWRGDGGAGSPLPAERRARSDAPYQDIPGFCKSAKLDEIHTHGHVLTPGRFVGAEEIEGEGEPFKQKMKRLTATSDAQMPSRQSWKRQYGRISGNLVMAAEWKETTFGELTEIFDGQRKPVKETDRKPGAYPYYGASGIVDHVEKYIFDGGYRIAEDGENLRTHKTPVAFPLEASFG